MKNIIFDFDGTLIDSTLMWEHFDRSFLLRNNVVPPNDLASKMEVKSLEQAAQYFSTNFDLEMDYKQILNEWDKELFIQYEKYLEPKPYAFRYVSCEKEKGSKCCIATMTEYKYAAMFLNRFDMLGKFEFILTSAQVGSGKDQPEMFLQAAQRLNAAPKDCTVFEGSLTAAKCAKGAGFNVCGILGSHSSSPGLKDVCDYTIESFKELL